MLGLWNRLRCASGLNVNRAHVPSACAVQSVAMPWHGRRASPVAWSLDHAPMAGHAVACAPWCLRSTTAGHALDHATMALGAMPVPALRPVPSVRIDCAVRRGRSTMRLALSGDHATTAGRRPDCGPWCMARSRRVDCGFSARPCGRLAWWRGRLRSVVPALDHTAGALDRGKGPWRKRQSGQSV